MRRPLWIAALLGLYPLALAAQGDCFPGAGSHEARAMALVSLPIVFTRAATPAVTAAGVSFGLEAARLPQVSDRLATPTICRPGKGPENINLLPGLMRPRVILGFGHGLELEGSWIPPIRVNQVKANLIGLALGKVVALSSKGAAVGLRIHATFGLIRAPITCNDAALRDTASECFGGQRSDDEFRPNTMGIEAAIGWPLAGGRLRPYGGVGYTRLQPRTRVNFTNSFGETDRRRVEVNLDRAALFGGVSWRASTRFELTGEMYGVPADGVTARLALRAQG